MSPQLDFSKGWIQRSNRNSYQPNELIDAYNVLNDPEGGGVATRLGDTVQYTVSGPVHSLYTTYTADQVPVHYQGGGTTLYRNGVPIAAPLAGTPISFASMPGYGEKKVYTFFAGGQEALRLKDDGTTLTGWGLHAPFAPSEAVSNTTGGFLSGNYAWRQVYVRKPVISGGVVARWDHASGIVPWTGTVPPWPLWGGTIGDGIVFGAPRPWDDVVLTFTPGPGHVGGSVEYAFWGGPDWVVWQTLPLGQVGTGLAMYKTNFSWNSWALLNGLYSIRIRVLVDPGGGIPQYTAATFYDGVYTTRSQPSPLGRVNGAYSSSGVNRAFVSMSNPLAVPEEPQATHVALYRTRGDDAAAQTPGQVAGAAAVFFFERDYPAGAVQHQSDLPDSALGEILETDNERPIAFDTIATYQQRIFGGKDNRLYFSKRGFPEEFPATNYVEVGTLADPIRRIGEYHGNLYVWTRARPFILVGSDEASYDTRPVQCPTGLGAIWSVGEGEQALYFLGSDGHLWALQGTIAANVSRIGHQQLFAGVTLHGVPAMTPAARSTCVGMWGLGRYYLAYPSLPATGPSTSLMVDEARGSWWRDGRAWTALFYDRQGDVLYGGLLDGAVVRLDSGTTDHGTLIDGFVQTPDDMAGAPDSDKDLSQLTVECTTASGLTITPVVSYALAPAPLGVVPPAPPPQVILPTPAPGTFLGLTLGYQVRGTAPWALYGLVPHVLRFPVRRRLWETTLTALSWPGPKILESLLLDVDLVSGTLAWQVLGDSVVVESGTLSQAGRQVTQLIHLRHEATVFGVVLGGTGLFLLYETSTLSWRPLPPPIYDITMVPTDLGTEQDKIGLSLVLDIDLLHAGTLTVTFWADGVLIHTLTYTTVGRTRTQRFRLPSTMHGRLMEIRIDSTAPFRLWPGTDFEYQQSGATQSQHYRPVQEPFGQSQTTPLMQLTSQTEAI